MFTAHTAPITGRRTLRRLLPGVLGLTFIAAMATGPQVVEARGVNPLDGRAWIPSESGCFDSSWTRVENSCNATRKWIFGATIDTSGNYHTFDVQGRGTGTGVLQCWVISTTADGMGGWSVSGQRSDATYGDVPMSAPSVFIPLHGALYVDCDLPAFTGGVKAGVSVFHYSA